MLHMLNSFKNLVKVGLIGRRGDIVKIYQIPGKFDRVDAEGIFPLVRESGTKGCCFKIT